MKPVEIGTGNWEEQILSKIPNHNNLDSSGKIFTNIHDSRILTEEQALDSLYG
jgi:hypothetical protein